MTSSTIVAVATPAGVGGIAVVRLCGPEAESLALQHLSASTLPPRQAVYCRFDDIDDLVAIRYAAPHSYTGEETVELSCHGSPYVQQAIVQALIGSGARLAEPGEFTLRAFRNGKINLSQSEAIADLIEAATPVQHRLAVSQLRGGYAQRLEGFRRQLIELAALLELELDFSQEDVEFADRGQLLRLVAELKAQVASLLASFAAGNALKRGIGVGIIGRPNAGKSSLLNALLGEERAIVSDTPGTTRDTVESTLSLQGLPFRFIDTAGLRQGADPVEQLGIQRSHRAVEEAQIVLCVHDVQLPWQAPEVDLEGKAVLTIVSKCDLAEGDTLPQGMPLDAEVIRLSAKTGEGLDALRAALVQRVQTLVSGSGEVMLTNVRHYHALRQLEQALLAVERGLQDAMPADLVAVDLRDALYHLGSITGEVASDTILHTIFSRFCIGK
ncbi:MAG: tRNA uridine-5-carboxymethylaminomethyl(34) synthesis GTPase MnmE [Bacteroidales bacterium]|nr:tRNA uridine-5-carboxymethylaminomethyl(34) synthesis GTPase MnmE [Bacteroidales bacterium]